MTPMLEKAASAAVEAVRANDATTYVGPGDLDDVTIDGAVNFYAIARAVLMAVREPDDELLWQVCEASNRPLDDDHFPAIIDAILNNPNPPSVKDETE